ncbi:MAG TPA: GNAT family N-acetyltransferase [Jatrophihabitans sp.]|jgi:GNAT superfamily N-acetyltransferase|nr:GNAT family N-acetyltransferase [Jatrophihabitans sp.]
METQQAEAAIRPLTSDDIDAVVAACDWLFEPPASVPEQWDPAAARERLLQLTTATRSRALVAEFDATIVGFCTVYLDIDSLRFGQRAWLNELAVHPAYRSRGIGRRLLHAGRQWARSNGATMLMLDSSNVRMDAHRFYRRAEPSVEARCFGWRL